MFIHPKKYKYVIYLDGDDVHDSILLSNMPDKIFLSFLWLLVIKNIQIADQTTLYKVSNKTSKYMVSDFRYKEKNCDWFLFAFCFHI